MNFPFQIIRFFLFFILSFFILRWYLRKKGLERNIKTILFYIISWKTLMFCVLIGADYLNDQIGRLDLFNYYYEALFFPIILVILSLIINFLLGILFFEFIFKEIMHEFVIIIIVTLEFILDNCVLYPIFYFL